MQSRKNRHRNCWTLIDEWEIYMKIIIKSFTQME